MSQEEKQHDDGEPSTKRTLYLTETTTHDDLVERNECVDAQRRALLAFSRYSQERWVRAMVMLHMTRGAQRKFALLSGDAGCGKSYAISLLYTRLRNMGVSILVSAMTNRSAGTLRESHSLQDIFTFHRMMGFKKELLDPNLSLDEFGQQYSKLYWNVITQFKRLYTSDFCPSKPHTQRHSCRRIRPELCALCSKLFGQLKVASTDSGRLAPMEDAPPFLGMNVLVVDEYGLLNVQMFERMQRCLDLFYGSGGGPLIVFAGSVSQLQPVGSQPRIWQTDRFAKLLSSSTPLFVNRRQFQDPGYAEALTYLQFNTVTRESRSIFRSQVSVSEQEIMDPDYAPNKPRIFHQDGQQVSYTGACMNKARDNNIPSASKFLELTQTRRGANTRYDVLKQAAQVLPKLFSVPKFNPAVLPKEKDYLNIQKVWVGCRVRMTWHMDHNGIQVANESMTSFTATRGWSKKRPQKQLQSRASCKDMEGVVCRIAFNRDKGYNEFYVRGCQTDTMYKVSPSKWNYKEWTVTTHPITPLVAMNTYDCQGCTVSGQVLYHPPKCFFLSPIKPSVYVALSRVSKRENLQMTNCNFAQTIGTVDFYDKKLVEYRKRVEMDYSL